MGGSLEARIMAAWQQTEELEASGTLFAFIISMLVAQLSQAMMVKYSSATFTILGMVIVVPMSSLVFALHSVMGSRAEKLPGATPYAIALVFIGIVVFRFGDITAQVADPEQGHGLMEVLLTPQLSFGTDEGGQPPRGPSMLASGTGIISSEYTAARQSPAPIWMEGTVSEVKRGHADLDKILFQGGS